MCDINFCFKRVKMNYQGIKENKGKQKLVFILFK